MLYCSSIWLLTCYLFTLAIHESIWSYNDLFLYKHKHYYHIYWTCTYFKQFTLQLSLSTISMVDLFMSKSHISSTATLICIVFKTSAFLPAVICLLSFSIYAYVLFLFSLSLSLSLSFTLYFLNVMLEVHFVCLENKMSHYSFYVLFLSLDWPNG